MKRFSIFAWVIVALMSLSFYSCDPSSDNDDSSVTQMIIAKLTDSSISGGYLITGDGIKMKPTNFPLYSYSAGLYMFTCTYNPYEAVDNELNITINSSDLVDITSPYGILPTSYVTDDNMPLYGVHVQRDYDLYPWMFDEQYLIVPVCFWGVDVATQTEYDKELAKHRFVMCYEEPSASDTELKLRLTDKVDEENPSFNRYTNYYENKAFDLANIINYFKSKTGSAPKKISISAKVNSRPEYEGASDETFTIDLNN